MRFSCYQCLSGAEAESYICTYIFFIKKFDAFRPSTVKGSFITIFFAILDNFSPSLIISSKEVAVTSALIGPVTNDEISAKVSKKSFPDFAIKEGLVVTPSTKPVEYKLLILSVSAVSRKISYKLCY